MERVLPGENQRQERGAGKTLLDRARRRRGLHDGRALRAALLRADVPGDGERDGLRLEHLGLVRAERLQRTAAVRASAVLRLDDMRDALEVLGQLLAAHRLALGGGSGGDLARGLRLALGLEDGGLELLEAHR